MSLWGVSATPVPMAVPGDAIVAARQAVPEIAKEALMHQVIIAMDAKALALDVLEDAVAHAAEVAPSPHMRCNEGMMSLSN